jgi:maltose phosphorylase
MKQYLKHDPWKIIEEGFSPEHNRISESVFSLGNGRMGQRATFEEVYSGDTHQGSYVAGVYYPDKTRVGWWKNGYPEYFAKVLNAPSWIDIHISIDGEVLDLAKSKVENFRRELNMQNGLLTRTFTATLVSGKKLAVEAKRFCSMADGEIGAIRYSFTPLNFSGTATIVLPVDATVVNKDSNYDEKFWDEIYKSADADRAIVVAETKKTKFHVCTGIAFQVKENDRFKSVTPSCTTQEKYAAISFTLSLKENQHYSIEKYAVVLSSENHKKDLLVSVAEQKLLTCKSEGFDKLFEAHQTNWFKRWEGADISIEGDIAAQQGIRFNIFQLMQTYTGEDERLNIGPKGFTGEKYGGSTYWDTEAYCLPFYLGTADEKVARNLLVYRYKHLQRAIENAAKLGFTNGAALYPMVTMNGEECHNEWEITFEEIHRNGAIAYGIYDYIRYTGEESYLTQYGLEVLIAISRFWAQRVNWSSDKQKYVMLGVTGPNEYENNVNNNWYSNLLASWTLEYTLQAIDSVKRMDKKAFESLASKIDFNEAEETAKWIDIRNNIHLPEDSMRGVFLQQDGFLDKDLLTVDQLRKEDRPLNQKWSWDRILRSCFIKQADVLQGMYFFEERFTKDELKRNFDFYEPMTVHESSLSPCVHVILASVLGYKDKAYEMYLRTSRLDLDDYNNDTEDGCHITSMAGTWMSVIKGFGGMRVRDGKLHFNPYLPEQWKSYAFKVEFRGRVIQVNVSKTSTEINVVSGEPLEIVVGQEKELV